MTVPNQAAYRAAEYVAPIASQWKMQGQEDAGSGLPSAKLAYTTPNELTYVDML
jgi:hypothetical protein